MKRITSSVLSFVMLLSVTAGLHFPALAAESGDFEYEILDDGTAEITIYYGSATELTIPSTLGGYTVTNIGDGAFLLCDSLASVTIPDSVTGIGDYAFEDCKNLTSITIPDSVKSIGDDAFDNTAYYNNASHWEDGALYIGKFLIDSRGVLSKYTVKDGTLAITDKAFGYYDSLTSITIPNSVTGIGDEAFYGCSSLESITIPNSVISIGDEAFYGCDSLTSITVDANNKNYASRDGVLFNKNETELIQYPCGNKRTSYTIPDSVMSIANGAFAYYNSLASITIPASVTSIGDCAFEGCNSLIRIAIENKDCDIYDSEFTIADGAVIYGYKGSTAEAYANKYGRIFKIFCNVHTWDSGEITEAATCGADGVKTYTCTVCGATKTETIAKTNNHNWDSGKVTKAATCGADGVKTYTCTVCGTTKTETIAKTNNHNWDSGKVTKAATCGADGVKTYTCTICGTTKTETIVKTNNHEWGEWVADGNRQTRKCSVCGATESKTVNVPTPVISSIANTTEGIEIKWSNPSGAKYFRVYRKTNGSRGWTSIGTAAAANYTDKTVKSGTKYTYTVRALSDNRSSFISGYDNVGKTKLFVAAPKITSISCESSGVIVKWGKSAGTQKYRIYRKTGNGGWSQVGATTGLSFTDKTAINAATYTYTVRCVGTKGNYLSDFDKTGKTVKFASISVISSISNTTEGIEIKWNNPAGAKYFRVYRKTNGSSGWTTIGTAAGTSYTDKTVKSGTKYNYTVRALSDDRSYFISGYDNVGKTKLFVAAPKIKAVTVVKDGINIKWNKSSGAQVYRIYRKTGNGSWSQVGATTGLSFTDKTAKNGTTYTYTVRCVGTKGNYLSDFDKTGKSITITKP